MSTSAEPYIYADNAATTPLSPAALDAMMPYLTNAFGNPSGIHRVAREAAEALADARARIAGLLDASSPDEIYFTSGGSESDTWILQGAARRFRDSYGAEAPVRIVTSAIEHHAVLHTCEALERAGVEITVLPVDDEGFVSPDDLACVLAQLQASTGADEHVGAAAGRAQSAGDVGSHDRPDAGASLPPAALVSIMLANNEVGSIQNIEELARIAHEFGVPFHTDAVQAVGHIPVSIKALGVDALSLSAHKFHGPRGTGALYLKDGFSIPPLIAGGARSAACAPERRISRGRRGWRPLSKRAARDSPRASRASAHSGMRSRTACSPRAKTSCPPARAAARGACRPSPRSSAATSTASCSSCSSIAPGWPPQPGPPARRVRPRRRTSSARWV